jgi:ABC-type transporter Mla MlaB component
MTSCEQIRELSLKCAKAIGDKRRSLIIDLVQVERADTKLMACLVSIYQLALSSSVSVELRPSASVLDLAEFCRLGWLIERTAASNCI